MKQLSLSLLIGLSPLLLLHSPISMADPIPEPLDTTKFPDAPKDWELLVLAVSMDRFALVNALPAYQAGNVLMLPLGELAMALSLSVQVNPITRRASGFIIEEHRRFSVDMAAQTITTPEGGSTPFNPKYVRWLDGDIYVAAHLLQHWWPLVFDFHREKMQLTVNPTEILPLQARLEREKQAERLSVHRGIRRDLEPLPYQPNPFQWVSVPILDHSLSYNMRYNPDATEEKVDHQWRYSGLLSGDLLGMEASLFLNTDNDNNDIDTRFLLSRESPDIQRLGPIGYRRFQVGQASIPQVNHVMRSGVGGNSLSLTNRERFRSTQFGLHNLRGDLPQGWDVSLFFNDALVGFQSNVNTGQYEFLDLPLVYGNNEFRLVFNGPMGESRTERQVFLLDRTLVKPGEFYYNVAIQQDDAGALRQLWQTDFGLTDKLAAGVTLSHKQGADFDALNTSQQDRTNQRFANVNLRSTYGPFLLGAEFVVGSQKPPSSATGDGDERWQPSGQLWDFNVRTRFRRWSINAHQVQLSDSFASEAFSGANSAIKSRSSLGLNGSVKLWNGRTMPLALDYDRDALRAGGDRQDVSARFSGFVLKTHWTKRFSWQKNSAGDPRSTGTLQLSRSVFGFNMSGQLAYSIEPETELQSLAISGNQSLNLWQSEQDNPWQYNGGASRFTWSLSHSLVSDVSSLSLGITHRFKSMSVNLSGLYTSEDSAAIGLRIFSAFGREPRNGRWMSSWQPMAASGVVSAQAFLDNNLNGIRDPDEEAIENVGFKMNRGSRGRNRTDETGVAYLSGLSPYQYTDIRIDTKTLEDPFWQTTTKGARVLPRPGRVQVLEFPVVTTGEIDGTVFLKQEGNTRGIGNAQIQLIRWQTALTAQPEVVANTKSSSDGFYLLTGVLPGEYALRVAPQQLVDLGLTSHSTHRLTITAQGDVIYGQDFVLEPKKIENKVTNVNIQAP